MLFKQMQIFQVTQSQQYFYDSLIAHLQTLTFQPCLPSLPVSIGWVAPVEEGWPLVEQINQRLMICMQVEEKILPAAVVKQALQEKIKQLESTHDRKLGKKEKNSLKDEVITTLLPRTFSKFSRVYAYIDTKHNWLVLGSNNKKKTEQFLTLFKKTLNESVQHFELKKVSNILTHWVNQKNYPESFTIEKKCVLQDANQKSRVIRCQHQDLFVDSIYNFIKDGCELKQLGLSWRDSIQFVLSDDFSLRSMQFADELLDEVKSMEAETRQQKFMADFFMMSETISALLQELLAVFVKTTKIEHEINP